METKTYFANNVPAALEVARQELGPDALLLNSRPSPDEMRHLGRLEVTFAWDSQRSGGGIARNEFPPEMPAAVTFPITGRAAGPGTSRDLDDIRDQLAALRIALSRGSGQPTEGHDDPMVTLLAAKLSGGGLTAELAREVAVSVHAANRDPHPAIDESVAVEMELASRIPVARFTEMKPEESRTLALIGPPGRGKTTTLIKLAIRLGLSRRVPVRIYSAGVHGVGGREQMARFAAILGTPQHALESLDALHLAMKGDGWRGLALIDTPGLSPSETDELTAFSRFFATHPEIEKHLVLRAEARQEDMLQTLRRFAPIQPSTLLFTGLDESTSAGATAELLIRSRIPAAFFGIGPRIPDDLQEADARLLARRVCAHAEVAASRQTAKVARAAA